MGDRKSLTVDVGINSCCLAIVVIPARNEEAHIVGCLDPLTRQEKINPSQFEIIIFLNNCKDRTAARVRTFAGEHPQFCVHICEDELSSSHANIGNVRRLLMNKACERLLGAGKANGAILTTDADTSVDRQWIAQNLQELNKGADLVGGRIILNPDELRSLAHPVRRRYYWETAYSLLLAKLESRLDPLFWDPWPRHHQNFCGSLAISAGMYRQVGGVPKVETLEDIALCKSVLEANGKIRHSPNVTVCTSARTSGRVEVGLSSHLQSFDTQEVPMVEDVCLTAEKFRAAGAVRRAKGDYAEIAARLDETDQSWRQERKEPIDTAIHKLYAMLDSYV